MFFRLIVVAVMIYLSFEVNSQQVKINEVMTANASAIMDPDNYNFSEWTELYNEGNEVFSISGYYFSNDPNNLKKWMIPYSYTIPPKGYVIIWMDKLDAGLHTNFRARSNRELLLLSNTSGVIVDSISVNHPVRDHSFGRNPDGSNVWSTFETPTPGESNTGNILNEQCAQPVFNLPAGRYSSDVTITLDNPGNSGTIYYSIDGSDPTENSTVYNSPITLTRTLTVKARILEDGKIPGTTVANTYFINEHPFTLPLMVSLTTDLAYLWDSQIGIYVEGNNGISGYCYGEANWNQDWERPAHIEIFTTNGKKVIDSDVGIRIAGGCSRRFDQKSFSVYFRDKYGNDKIKYPLFNSKHIDRFKSIMLRNSGDDNLHSQFHDGFIQTLIMDQMNLDYLGFTPSATYLNGEYWGILNIREKATEDYLFSNYGLDDDSVDMLERDYNVIAGSNEDYLEMLEYLSSHDLAISENYNFIKDQIDIESFIDYQIAEIFVANHDWPENNVKFWKSKKPGSKWRWIYYDTDFGFGLDYGAEDNTLEFATDPNGTEEERNPPYSTFVFRSLLNNEEFKNRFIDKFLIYIGSTYRTERTLYIIDSINNLMISEINNTFDLWDASMTDYDWWIYCKKNFAIERPAYMIGFLRDYFGLQSSLPLKVKSNTKDRSLFSIDDVIINDTVLDGEYITNRDIKLKAIGSCNFKFNHWEILKNQQTEIIEQKEIEFPVTSELVITAVFDSLEIVNNIFINEICPSNSTYPDEALEYDDWIELFDAGNEPINLAGLYMTDDFTEPTKYKIPKYSEAESTILPGGFKIFWADGQPEQGLLHLDFKLDKDGGEVGLVQVISNDTVFLDSITYPGMDRDYSYGRYEDGSNTWMEFSGLTPGAKNLNTNVPEPIEENDITIFPNPVSSYAKIMLPSHSIGPIQITVMDVRGIVQKEIELNWQSDEGYWIDFSGYSEGIYIVRIKSSGSLTNLKVLKLN
jgi:hypothetical protein